jgi:hypothetical protein
MQPTIQEIPVELPSLTGAEVIELAAVPGQPEFFQDILANAIDEIHERYVEDNFYGR